MTQIVRRDNESIDDALRRFKREVQKVGVLREARKHAAWYTKGLRGAAKVRSEAMNLCTMADLEAYIRLVLAANGED